MDIRTTSIIGRTSAVRINYRKWVGPAIDTNGSGGRAVCLKTSALSSLNMMLKFLVDGSRQNSSIFGLPHCIYIGVTPLCFYGPIQSTDSCIVMLASV